MLRTADKRLFVGDMLRDVLRPETSTQFQTEGENTATTVGTTITAGSPAHVKGSYAALAASAPFDADGFYLHAGGGASLRTDILIDIAIGGAGSEVVIVPNLLYMAAGVRSQPVYFHVPIKAGTRVAARSQSITAGATAALIVTFARGGLNRELRLARATTYGANTADSGGVGVDPGATINTKGAWAEISASLTNPIEALILCVGARANAAIATAGMFLDLGIGAGGSEVVILDNWPLRAFDGDDVWSPFWSDLRIKIPAGQRLATRAQCTINDAADRLIDVTVTGFDGRI